MMASLVAPAQHDDDGGGVLVQPQLRAGRVQRFPSVFCLSSLYLSPSGTLPSLSVGPLFSMTHQKTCT